MGTKLLFLVVIVAAHGAVAAGLAHTEAPATRIAATSCVSPPSAQPDFTPSRMLYAAAVVPVADEEVMQP
jgi:hypothetical protein